ncbi:hypothetical protein U1Q18_009724 [Sarracenia purpurea var. burkii]
MVRSPSLGINPLPSALAGLEEGSTQNVEALTHVDEDLKVSKLSEARIPPSLFDEEDDAKQDEGEAIMDTFVLRVDEDDRVLMVGKTQQKDKAGPTSRAKLSQGFSETLQNPPQRSEEDDDDQEKGENTTSALESRAAALAQDKVQSLQQKPGTYFVGSGFIIDTWTKNPLDSDPLPQPRGGGRGQGYHGGRFGAKRTDLASDIPSSSTGPLGDAPEASFPPDPVSRDESSSPSNPAIRKEHAATASPHPGNKFALLSEDLGLPEVDAADHLNTILDVTDSPMAAPDSNQAQVSSPIQSPQHSPQSQSKQTNKKADSKGKKKRRSLT